MRDLKPNTIAVFNFLKQYIAEIGYPPSVKDISEAVHLTGRSVTYHLLKLDSMGYIRRDFQISRGIVILKDIESTPVVYVALYDRKDQRRF